MKLHLLAVLAATSVLTSCAPRIGTALMKTYPALDAEEPVTLIMSTKGVPPDIEALGIVSIRDAGFTTHCDSATVAELLKQEARKAGGNVVIVTEYIKPSFWGSSCHQMTGTVARINENSPFANEAIANLSQIEELRFIKPERKLPRMNLYAGGGYGWRMAELSPDLTGYMRTFTKGLMHAPVWDASFNYYFNDLFGVGLAYAAYGAGNREQVYNMETLEEGYLKLNDLITYAGPVFLVRNPLSNKWTLESGIGFGYLGYVSKGNFVNEHFKKTGATAGAQVSLGIEYKLAKDWGIGLNLSAVSGILNSWTEETNGVKTTVKAESNDKGEGLGQFRMLLGVRYHIK
ncbi:hypothetical protein Barb6_00497 [Bacteroidales bacterium Barb6]|nr:hypothetical protein Barb6_00497 [Bacteroidales bacterium Barb6]